MSRVVFDQVSRHQDSIKLTCKNKCPMIYFKSNCMPFSYISHIFKNKWYMCEIEK